MKNNLEDFIKSHREEFDSYEPSNALWSRIENKLQAPKKRAIVVSMTTRKLMSAAAALVIIAAAAFFYKMSTTKPDVSVASVTAPISKIPDAVEQPSDSSTEKQFVERKRNESAPLLTPITKETPESVSNETLKSISEQEMLHYTKLVELKQAQISILKKDEPLLYMQFADDFDKIDKEFKALKKQETNHPNNEQLLEAMIQNLRLQSALLNRQLEIIKAINNNKKKSYENTYNSTI